MVNQRIINKVRDYLLLIPSELGLKKAYLFGSFAKGKEHEGSDIDIALVLNSMDDFFSVQRELMRLRRTIDLRIEPHPIAEEDFKSTNPFAEQIEKFGIEISLKSN